MVFGDTVGIAVMHLVFPFKLMEYRLLFSENMLKCIWRNRLDMEDKDCLYVLYKPDSQSGPGILSGQGFCSVLSLLLAQQRDHFKCSVFVQ